MRNITAASHAGAAVWCYSCITSTETQLESHQDAVQRQPCWLTGGFALQAGRSSVVLGRFAEPGLGELQMGTEKGSGRLKPQGSSIHQELPGSALFFC